MDASKIVPVSDKWSISFWFKTQKTLDSSTVFSATDATNSDRITVYIASDGAIGFDVDTNTTYLYADTDTTGFNDNKWHHCVITINFDTKARNFFVDGKLEADTASNAGSISGCNPDAHAYIGARYDLNNTQYFVGELSNIFIFQKILHSSNAQTLYKHPAAPLEKIIDATTQGQSWPITQLGLHATPTGRYVFVAKTTATGEVVYVPQLISIL